MPDKESVLTNKIAQIIRKIQELGVVINVTRINAVEHRKEPMYEEWIFYLDSVMVDYTRYKDTKSEQVSVTPYTELI